LFGTRRLTEDGLEHTFALNHMSYFVVTEGLRERLLASGAARIVNTASAAHQGATLDSTIFNPRRASEPWGPIAARSYATSCLRANLLGACMAPAWPWIVSILASLQHVSPMKAAVRSRTWLAKFFAISSAEGAQTIIYLASSPEVANVAGKYFYKCRPTNPSAPALDDRAALALWQRSAALAGMEE
jgi:NAD(P)-dependent dehydrogenase (short-subunit alcohol dehydrogenase family)